MTDDVLSTGGGRATAAAGRAAGDSSGTDRVGVVGCGLMGSGIAEVCARTGRDVAAGELTAAGTADAAARITVTTDLKHMADRDLVIEAVAEDERAKVDVLARLDAVVDGPDAVLATNTSSIPVVRLAAATSRPEQVIGMHFFHPVPVLPLVELVPSLLTGEETVHRAEAFASGVALDTVRSIARSMYAEHPEPLYAPPPLSRRVEAGLLARTSGRGFHVHPGTGRAMGKDGGTGDTGAAGRTAVPGPFTHSPADGRRHGEQPT